MTLAAQNLSLQRGGARVLDDVSATLAHGQITAIVGPNGAGKSSLLMALTGLLDPAEGSVTLEGKGLQTFTPPERARALGYLPQDGDIAWDVSVEALIALGRMPHRDADSDSGKGAIERAIAALGLETLRTRPVSQLSGGEEARVLLARVMAGQPRWILADEPLAALDLGHKQALLAHLRTIAATGVGVVIVVHDLAVAMNHADRALVLDQGTLVADAQPQDALSDRTIEQVWKVKGEWVGVPGRQAYSVLNYG